MHTWLVCQHFLVFKMWTFFTKNHFLANVFLIITYFFMKATWKMEYLCLFLLLNYFYCFDKRVICWSCSISIEWGWKFRLFGRFCSFWQRTWWTVREKKLSPQSLSYFCLLDYRSIWKSVSVIFSIEF